ncbi:hypothetical protein AWW66_03535 [Micromonospora rosaria]|uniref:HTH cro/C1-type domain-containing protein n=1 Tax=Micromonospora rosaria TaxID=47874 RepID=A0A136PY52_9ACTN|nr:helix-turn-helix transcriptional regulator [Micromonospora rosaria]KXK63399.1 hypothetical protein AWW66_03535 [Micromonospora rosaria]
MRNTQAGQGAAGQNTWAAYAKQAREAATPPISQSELARRLGTDRTTVWRWEKAKQKPESADIVVRFADLVGVPRDEALAAAGLHPDIAPPPAPTLDDEVELILSADIDEDTRRAALEQLHRMRLRDKERRMEDIRFFLRGRR